MFIDQFVLAAASLAGLAVLAATFLRAWHGWLGLKREERALAERGSGESSGMARIEIADIKERLRKLEAIAAGVDL